MKTTSQPTIAALSERSGITQQLIHAVLRQLGGGADARSNLEDIARHGVDAGYCGFTYTRDTVAFFKAHRSEIVDMAEHMALDIGENVADMVAGFQCLAGRSLKRNAYSHDHEAERHNRAMLAQYLPSVSRCLYGGRLTDADDDVANALAWFAAEEVARAYSHALED